MAARLTPFMILVLVTGAGLVAAATSLFIALNQPWLGVTLAAGEAAGLVRIDAVAPRGPAGGLTPGMPLLAVGDISIEAADLVEEPDIAEDYAAFSRFFERQSLIHNAVSGPQAVIRSGEGLTTVTPAARRPVADLPAVFWMQIGTGLVSMVVGGWVWSLRRAELSAALLAVAGAGVLVSAFTAAIYSSRELALPGGLFRGLSAMNHLGTLTFGVAMAALFLIYPRRLVPLRLLWAGPPVFGAIWIMDTARIGLAGPQEGIYLPSIALMLTILLGALLQYRASKGDPAARAAVRWFALSVGMCAGTFVIAVLMPVAFGMTPSVSQGHAFVLFGMLFLGIAAGVARHRLFELESWAFSIFGYLAAGALLVLLDALLISFVAMDRPAAFALSLLAVAFIYLPFRDRLARWLMPKREIDRKSLFGRIVDVALSGHAHREQEWHGVLQDTFLPLHMQGGRTSAGRDPVIAQDGLSLELPELPGLAPVTLSHAHAGRRLFSPQDRRLAGEICAMLSYAITSRNAHERGAVEERMRIARDMHDNMGAQLLSALYNSNAERKDTLIRETISDLRDIVNNAARGGKTIEELLADLKVETLERLSAADIRLEWQDECDNGSRMLSPNVAHSLRSVLREIVSNTIRHSGATVMRVTFAAVGGTVRLDVADDGCGLTAGSAGNGNGLSNVEARLLALKGTFDLRDAGPGLAVQVRFPLCEASQA